MRKLRYRMPNEVLEKVFPKKLNRDPTSKKVYFQLNEIIPSRKLRKEERILPEEIAQTVFTNSFYGLGMPIFWAKW
jgi:hypothetical protein